jgi:hypothetical protein
MKGTASLFIEKLRIAQLLKKFIISFPTRKFIDVFERSHH